MTEPGQDGDEWMTSEEVDSLRLPFDGRCWWCGSTDLSSEHKFKAADLRTMGNELLWSDGDERRLLRSPNDKRAKFRVRNLCKKCNNERAQSSDRAWDQFGAFIRSKRADLRLGQSIPLRSIYGWRGRAEGQLELGKYIVRHFGCRISEAGCDVPEDIRDFLNSGVNKGTLAAVPFFSDIRMKVMGSDRSVDGYWLLTTGGLVAQYSKSAGRFTQFATEISLDAVGFYVEWSEDFDRGRVLGRRLLMQPRESLPYEEMHNPLPGFDPG